MNEILIKNVRVVDPENSIDRISSVFIKDGVFADLKEATDNALIIDGKNLTAVPGLVDLHVHLRDPGFTYKEDIISGCKSAAAGGVTSILAMPNTKPAADNPETVKYILDKAKNADANVYVVGAISKDLESKIPTDIEALKKAGCIALSDDGKPAQNTKMMAEAMIKAHKLGMLVTAHCEDPYLARGGIMNDGEISKALNVCGMPSAAEDIGTEREILLAKYYDVPVHICHVSTAQSVELIRLAKKQNVKVTAETAPHYIALTQQELLKRDADYRMNPPLRTEKDRQAIIEGLCDGTLDAIATDHAPHSAEEKSDFEKAPNGSVGMETSFSVSYTELVIGGKLTLSQLIQKMSCVPAKLLKIEKGTMSIGKSADLMLFDENEKWIVNPEKLHGKSKNTPFKNMQLTSKVKLTICGGKIVFDER